MGNDSNSHINIRLNDIQDLFVSGEVNPFTQKEIYCSGIETVYQKMKISPFKKRSVLTISIPKSQIKEDTDNTIRSAINRYCLYQINISKQDIVSLLWEGLKALQTGVVFLVICLFVAFILEPGRSKLLNFNKFIVQQPFYLSSFLIMFIREGLFIVGWVSMWKPIELFLYDWWPHWRKKNIYENIIKLELLVEGWG
ncbi:MAG: hypothetical protein ABIH39_03655 [Candidatus Margulisiibacteriota bacterium]